MSSYSAAVLTDSPLAYYRCGESAGTTATDSSGNARDGGYVNSPTLGVAGLLTRDANTAVTLAAASSQEVTSANAAALNLTSMMHEVVFSTTDPKVIVRDHTALNGWFFALTGTNPVVRVSGTSYTFTGLTSASLLTGTRQHVVWGADPTTVYLYVNGMQYTAVRGAATAAVSPWHLGRNGGNSAVPADFLSGTVDEWAIYSSLSAARVAAHYDALMSGLPPYTLTFRADLSGTAFGAAPTWTDLSSYVLAEGQGEPVSITWGRQDEESDVTPSTMSLVVENADGRFTPKRTASPYYPYVRRGFRANLRLTVSGTIYDLFDGYAVEIAQAWPGGSEGWSVVRLTFTDITARLAAAQPLYSMLEHEMLADAPTYLYTLGEEQGSKSAGDLSGRYGPAKRVDYYGTGALTFGQNAGLFDEGTGIKNAADFQASGSPASALAIPATFAIPAMSGSPFSVEAWIVPPVSASPAQPGDFVSIASAGGTNGKYVAFRTSATSGRVTITITDQTNSATVFSTTGINLCDGALHQAVATLAADLKTVKLYIDGLLVGTSAAAAPIALTNLVYNYMGASTGSSGKAETPFPGVLSHVAMYPSELSAARVLAHYQAGVGTATEGSGARYARIAGYANVTTAGLPTGLATMGTQKTLGKTVTQALAEVARTEGTASYATGAGALTFQARNARYSATAGLTLVADDIDPGFPPRDDGQGFFNELTVTSAAGASQRVVNTTSQTQYGRSDGGSFEVAPSADFDALQNASWQVALHKDPDVRVASVVLDLLTQTSTTKTQNALSATIGTLISITGLPSNAPSSSLNLFVEGGKHTIGLRSWDVEFFTSPSLPFTTLRADASASSRTKLDNGLKIPF